MRSAVRNSQTAFRRARVRLTAWYVGALAVFLVILGTTVYLVQKNQLESNIDAGLRVTGRRVLTDARAGRWGDVNAINAGFRYYVVQWSPITATAPTDSL